jgi:hypothetical protein
MQLICNCFTTGSYVLTTLTSVHDQTHGQALRMTGPMSTPPPTPTKLPNAPAAVPTPSANLRALASSCGSSSDTPAAKKQHETGDDNNIKWVQHNKQQCLLAPWQATGGPGQTHLQRTSTQRTAWTDIITFERRCTSSSAYCEAWQATGGQARTPLQQ